MDSVKDIWGAVLESLSTRLTPTAMTTWFSECDPVDIEGTNLILHVPSKFKREMIEQRFSEDIQSVLSDIFSCEFGFRILSDEEYTEWMERDHNPREGNSSLPDIIGYTFDEFIVGESNRFAWSAARGVAREPGGTKINPFFIYGNSGLGKTHLLLSIAHDIHINHPEMKIVYVKANDFLGEMVQSLQEKNMDSFKDKYRSADLFLVDDIQFISGKTETQNEFFHTFNSIYEAGHQIVITSDRPPKDMALLDERLRTRFEGGVMADIAPPDYETRVAIIRNKAAKLALPMTDGAVDCLATKVVANIRQIEGVIKKLTAYKSLMGLEITEEWVNKAIASLGETGEYIPTPDKIIRETARYYSLTEEAIKGKQQSKNVSMARQISMYLIRNLTSYTLEKIGEVFDRNHATVISSIKKVEDTMRKDPSFATVIRDITSNINSD